MNKFQRCKLCDFKELTYIGSVCKLHNHLTTDLDGCTFGKEKKVQVVLKGQIDIYQEGI